MKVRIVSRSVIYNNNKNKILLVKNKGGDFWYPPGGEWDYEREDILQAAVRETKEEVGLNIKILRLLYLQEFHATANTIFFEVFWLATPLQNKSLDKKHIDAGGKVETGKWFSRDELQSLKVFPKRLKDSFWESLGKLLKEKDPFIGVI